MEQSVTLEKATIQEHNLTNIYFDISDFVFYLGHHDNVTGIQRVQCNVLLELFGEHRDTRIIPHIICYNVVEGVFTHIDENIFLEIARDIKKSTEHRCVTRDKAALAKGIFPGARRLTSLHPGSFLCILGAAWVLQDYFSTINYYKRQFGCKLLILIHDLIPIYCKDSCDQGTAQVFKRFLDTSFSFTDGYICVSENTRNDLIKYAAESGKQLPSLWVCKEGPGLQSLGMDLDSLQPQNIEDRYILFVSTIEGRKNHFLIFKVLQSLVAEGYKVPKVICVGRIGWKVDQFIDALYATNYLDNKFEIREDISDDELVLLYKNSWFTVFPSLYEGWGLPVAESLGFGKLCLASSSSSLPEASQGCAIHLDPYDFSEWRQAIISILQDETIVLEKERNIKSQYMPVSWGAVVDSLTDYIEMFEAVELPRLEFNKMVCYSFKSMPNQDVNQFNSRLVESCYSNPFSFGIPIVFSDPLIHEMREDYREWYSVEKDGIWCKYPAAKMRIPIPSDYGDMVCYLYLSAITSLGGKMLSVFVGKSRKNLKKVELKKVPGILQITLPRNLAICSGNKTHHLVELSVEYDPQLRDEIRKIDSRFLFLYIKNLLLVDKSDVATQLEILSNQIL